MPKLEEKRPRQTAGILRTKLRVPQASSFQIQRQDILQGLVDDLPRLLVVNGPAGFGKTTLMMQLRELCLQKGWLATWLTLDDADNDVARFMPIMDCVIDDLFAQQAKLDATVEQPQASSLSFESISAQLDVLTSPYIVFVDDFECIHNPNVLELARKIIEIQPPQAHVALMTRGMPEIALGRLRARGYMREITPSQLRFSQDETQDFLLNKRGLKLGQDHLLNLYNRTEGWVTGLWLASMALENHADPAQVLKGFSGSNQAVAEFLAEEVLGGLSPALRDFLFKTCILKELSEPLCDAVCSSTGSADILEQLEKANLFLIPLDEERVWYRYHSLFAQHLRAQQSKHLSAAEISELHRRAADWYLSRSRPVPAIQHALSSGDTEFAVPLMEKHLDAILGQGRFLMLANCLEGLPETILQSSPVMRIAQAWAFNFTRGPHVALELMDALDPEDIPDDARLHYHALRALALGMMDRIEESRALAEEVLKSEPPTMGFAYGMLAQTMTNTFMIMGSLREARSFADDARHAQEGSAAHFNIELAEAAEAVMDIMQGRLKQATIRLRLACEAGQPRGLYGRYGTAYTGIFLAAAYYEAGQLHRARRLLEIHIPLVRELSLPDHLITAHVLHSRILNSQGLSEVALEQLTELETIGHRRGLERIVSSARLERARLCLFNDDLEAASELIEAADAELWERISTYWFSANDTETLTVAKRRLQIHQGQHAEAIDLLKVEIDAAEGNQRRRRALKLRILQAEALARDNQHKPALRKLTKALEIAAPEGFVQTFLEEGPVVQKLLQECVAARQASATETDGDWALWFKSFSDSTAVVPVAVPEEGLFEPLTRKEQQVLELLAQGLSNIAMAEKLFVSNTTVRTHLRSINAKLRAGSRMQAVIIARQHGLIP